MRDAAIAMVAMSTSGVPRPPWRRAAPRRPRERALDVGGRGGEGDHGDVVERLRPDAADADDERRHDRVGPGGDDQLDPARRGHLLEEELGAHGLGEGEDPSASRTRSGLGLDAERDRPDLGLVLDRRARELEGEWPLQARERRERIPRRSARCGPRAPVRRPHEVGPSPRPPRATAPAPGAPARGSGSDLPEAVGARRRAAQLPRAKDRGRDAADRSDAVRSELLRDVAVGQLGQGRSHERRGVGAVEPFRDPRAVCDPTTPRNRRAGLAACRG